MPKNGTKRLFIALNLPAPVKAEIGQLIEALAEKYPVVKWVSPAGLHITLHFLGNMGEDQQAKIKLAMQTIESSFNEPLCFSLTELSGFPRPDQPRLLFVGCTQLNGKSVFSLHKLLGDHLKRLGVETDRRPWQPHITLGRVNNFETCLIDRAAAPRWQSDFTVSTFDLMESKLSPAGAIYAQVASYALSPAP